MRRARFWLVDVFTDTAYRGNPAAVVLLPDEADGAWMSDVAREFQCPNTAFVVTVDSGPFPLRWFTSGGAEVRICGHATMATARVLVEQLGVDGRDGMVFSTVSGLLRASPRGSAISLELPIDAPTATTVEHDLAAALGFEPCSVMRNSNDLVVVAPDERTVEECTPDLDALSVIPARGVMVTAPATRPGVDYVLRFFAPSVGVAEDNVTGTAHCALGPWWSARLGTTRLIAHQLSRRPGTTVVDVGPDTITIEGELVVVASGELLH